MSAPQVSPDVAAWERMRDVGVLRGWSIELTPSGRTKATKGGSVVFGPGAGGDYREFIDRLAHIDDWMVKAAARRP